MRKYKNYFYVILAAILITAIVVSCATLGSGKRPDRDLPQYTQKGWKNVKIVGGGMIPGIIYSTAQKDLAYVRTDMGGAYRWNPENESWIPLTDFAGVEDYGRLGISSIATDPVEPNRLVIASGTYTNDWDGTPSQMLVSEDYGDTFTRIDMPFKMGGNMPGRGAGERLAIDPNNNRVVYYGSYGNGLWRSRDYGHTWEEVRSFPTKGNVYDYDFTFYVDQNFKHFHGIMWVIFDPASGTPGSGSQNIYVGVADTDFTIYESTNGGATWRPLEGQPIRNRHQGARYEREHGHLVENCPCDNYYPIRAVYSPDGSLVTAWNHGFGPYSSSYQGGGIWKYTFATRTWTDISLPKHDYDPAYRTTDRGVGSVAVDWQNPNVLIAVTLNEWWPDEYIYRSTDGGRNWDAIWYLDGWPDRVNKYTMDIDMAPWLDWGEQKELPEQNPKLGWCIQTIVIDPFNSDRMMYGTGATIYGSSNLTEWDRNRRIKIEVMAEGIEECAILDLVAPTSGPLLYSGMGDIGGFVHTNLNRAPNMIVNPKIDGVNSIDYAAARPNYVVRLGGDGHGDEHLSKMGISSDYGRSWKPAVRFLEGAQGGWSGLAAVSADARIIIWAAGNMPPHWTDNEGRTWNVCTGIPGSAKVVSDRVNASRFYAYSDGVIYASTNAGRSFQVMNNSFITGNVTKSNLKAVVGEEGHLWFAAGDAGLYHSMDGGRTWAKFEGFDTIPIIGLGRAAPGADYQALYTNAKLRGQWGIYRSDDKGQNWIRINDDTKQFGAADTAITGCPRVYGRVYLATNGRGIQFRDLE
ncbi:MAG: xyloglucanase [Treponema sp.]|nr:xyloglucanase [Treponema sp.]